MYPSVFDRSIFHPSTQLHIYVYDAQTDTHTHALSLFLSLSLTLSLSHSGCRRLSALDARAVGGL